METRAGNPVSSALVWLGLTFLALAGLWLLVAAWEEGMSGGRDFVQDYAAVVKIGAGRNPYEPYNDVTQQLFGGPPHRGPLYSFHAPSSLPLLIWLLPFAKLWAYPGAFLAWGTVSLLALWSICWLTLRALGMPRAGMAGLLGALALITLPAIRECFEEGQLNVVVAAGMVGCWAARRGGRSTLAGVLLGIAFALKPIPGLFFLYYAWRRDWRLVVSAGATVAMLSVVGVGLAGLEGTWLWATVNYPSHAGVWPGYPDNASVRGYFTRIFGPSDWRPRPRFPVPYASMLLWMASGAFLTLAALAVARARDDDATSDPHDARPSLARRLIGLLLAPPMARDDPRGDLEVATLTALTLLVTPIVWPHYYVVLVMPVAILTVQLGRAIVTSRPAPAPDADPDDAVKEETANDWVPAGAGADWASEGTRSDEANDDAEEAARLSRRRRVVPALALVALLVATAILVSTEYVEPFRGSGGQLLICLLAVYGASLVALAWSGQHQSQEGQGRGVTPALAR